MSSAGSTKPLSAGLLLGVGVAGLVAGWAVPHLYDYFAAAEPLPAIWAVVVIWLLAVGVLVRAWQTWRQLHRGRPRSIEGFKAVNRLVLGQASALAGCGVLGANAGTMLARLGIPVTELTDDRLWRAGFAGLGALVLMLAGLWLERACRVPGDD